MKWPGRIHWTTIALLLVGPIGCGDVPPEENVGGGVEQAFTEAPPANGPPCKAFQRGLLVANATSAVERACSARGEASSRFAFATEAGPGKRPVDFRFESESFPEDRAALEPRLLEIADDGVSPATTRFLFDVIVPAVLDNPTRAASLFKDHLLEPRRGDLN